MHPTVIDRLHMREYARGIGDTSLERACNADLVRYGYRDEVVVPYTEDTPAGTETVETTEAVVEGQERAVPPKPRRGRKPMPRCEHNNIEGRCDACNERE